LKKLVQFNNLNMTMNIWCKHCETKLKCRGVNIDENNVPAAIYHPKSKRCDLCKEKGRTITLNKMHIGCDKDHNRCIEAIGDEAMNLQSTPNIQLIMNDDSSVIPISMLHHIKSKDDGNCMFSALAEGASLLSVGPYNHTQVRKMITDCEHHLHAVSALYYSKHGHRAFVSEPAELAKSLHNPTDDPVIQQIKTYKNYAMYMAQDRKWGGIMELRVWSFLLRLRICIYVTNDSDGVVCTPDVDGYTLYPFDHDNSDITNEKTLYMNFNGTNH